jgi:Omp85 superfamily domain
VRRLGWLLLLLALPPVLPAQDSVIVIDPDAPVAGGVERVLPPPEVVAELIEFYNDSTTTRVEGDITLPFGSRFIGPLALHRGNLRIAGRVDGPIAVANGTMHLLPGADVRGDILVIGGRLIRDVRARHEGRERVYWDAAPVLRTEAGLLEPRERRRRLGEFAAARTSFQTGKVRTTLLLATGGTYNRIEGLPIVFGPTFDLRTGRRSAFGLDLRGILRTAGSDSRLADFGYHARGEFRFGRFGIAGRVYSELTPIEEHPLSPSEVGWSSFLLQRDYRDYYDRRGYGGLAWFQADRSLRFEISRQRDDERSVRATDPWSLFRNSDRWRRNPLIDDGHYTTTGIQVDFDTRNERYLPSTGWLIRARFEHSSSADVAPVLLPTLVRPELPLGGGYAFDRLFLDVRRYSRLTPSLRVNARLRADGWVGGDRFPVQRRVSLGGPDLLPGYDFRAFTCAPRGFTDPSQLALCDRVITTQVEVRTRLDLDLGFRTRDRENRGGRFIGIEEADLVLLADAGKGWLAGSGPGQVPVNRIPSLDEWKVDVGIGLDAGEIAAYIAKGVSEDESVKFLVRLQRRF